MNQSTGRLQARMEAQRYCYWAFSFWNIFPFSEKTIKLRALTQWRQATREKIEEKKLSKLSSMMYKRLLMRRYFNQWASAVKSKWKSKVEKGNFCNIYHKWIWDQVVRKPCILVCKERATEICLKLKDELTSEINRLKCEVDNRDTIIGEMENKQQRYEEGLSKALMRGVCALNMEAMSVLNNPDFQGKTNARTLIQPSFSRRHRASSSTNTSTLERTSKGKTRTTFGTSKLSIKYHDHFRAASIGKPLPSTIATRFQRFHRHCQLTWRYHHQEKNKSAKFVRKAGQYPRHTQRKSIKKVKTGLNFSIEFFEHFWC